MEQANLWTKYQETVTPSMMELFGFTNHLRVPRLKKISINMGVGVGVSDSKAIQSAVEELALIAGQRPVVTKARISVAGFKLRDGAEIGCRVTLRGKMMYEFLDRLINIALPRIRDFRGLSPRSFDGRGNYTLGLSEQIVFPEIDVDKLYRTQGMDITIVTSAGNNREALELLRLFGMPFQREEEKS